MESGSVLSWNDAKGFGFIQPDSGKERVFFHISAVQAGRRPVLGDRLSFVSERDEQGRSKARIVKLVGSPARSKNPQRATPRASSLGKWLLIAALFLVAAVLYQSNALQNAIHQTSPYTADSSAPAAQQDELNQTLELIRRGGPFPYSQDGTTFGNREGLLPAQPRGYYREYTVETPGLSHRGARRVVTGGNPPQVYYYTSDHYRSFRQIEGP
ncbi:MAG TPA: ribonuclease domain-containing protein [Pseudomonas sp.]|nr:ribonuclease domain-containing protein [Pseudomonas sp.]